MVRAKLVGSIAVVTLSMAISATAAVADARVNPDGTITSTYAAHVLGVTPAQATADLALQRDTSGYVHGLQQAGDTVWYDNANATVHVYEPPSAAASNTFASAQAPAAATTHVVLDATPHEQTPITTPAPAESCGDYAFCSPIEGGSWLSSYAGNCAAGPIASDSYGNWYMLGAGHCDILGSSVLPGPIGSVRWPGLTNCNVGNPTVSVDAPWTGVDILIEPAHNAPSPNCNGMTPYLRNWRINRDILQQGAVKAVDGEVVCHYGWQPPYYSCGAVLATNVISEEVEPNGAVYPVHNTDQICMFGRGGDSGGTVSDATYPGAITGTVLLGGAYSGCAGGNYEAEQQIYEILGLHGLYVVT